MEFTRRSIVARGNTSTERASSAERPSEGRKSQVAKAAAEEEKTATLYEFVTGKLNDAFEKNIPVDEIKEMEDAFWRRVLGLIACSLVLVVFLYFVITSKSVCLCRLNEKLSSLVVGCVQITGYQSGVTSQFVSMSNNAGSCSYVPRSMSGTFLGTQTGIWNGQVNFTYNLALFEFQFTNYIGTDSDFAADMDVAYQELIPQTGFMNNSNLGVNLVFLQAAALIFNVGGSYQIMAFSPSPGYVYNREYIFTAFSTKAAGNCPYAMTSLMDSSTAEMATDVDVAYFQQNCSDANINWGAMGWQNYTNGDVFTMIWDYHSFVTALALNLGFRTLDTMELVQVPSIIEEYLVFEHNGITYRDDQYFDPGQPGMAPIQCITYEATGKWHVSQRSRKMF
jgi:hypothetical protein